MTQLWYCTREDVKEALDFKDTARSNRAVDSAIEAASRDVESQLVRTFFPVQATRYFDWPNRQSLSSVRLWVGADEIVSLTTLVSGGVTIPAADYFLEPVNLGAPYTRIEIDLSSSSSFGTAGTTQRAVAATGVFAGCPTVETTLGVSASAFADTTGTAVVVDGPTSAGIGVGSILRVGTERMPVTGRTASTTTVTISGDHTASAADVTWAVSLGTGFAAGEVILVDSERMLIMDVVGNTLTVKRAWDGSVLAAHTTGATVYAYRTLVVERGALGSTAATHLTAQPVYRLDIPGPVRDLTISEAMNKVLQKLAGMARVVGTGDNQRPAGGQGLEDLRRAVVRSHGRRARYGRA